MIIQPISPPDGKGEGLEWWKIDENVIVSDTLRGCIASVRLQEGEIITEAVKRAAHSMDKIEDPEKN